jgi:hypothetical protein
MIWDTKFSKLKHKTILHKQLRKILDSGLVKFIDCVFILTFLQNFSTKLHIIFIVPNKYSQYVYILVFASLAYFLFAD